MLHFEDDSSSISLIRIGQWEHGHQQPSSDILLLVFYGISKDHRIFPGPRTYHIIYQTSVKNMCWEYLLDFTAKYSKTILKWKVRLTPTGIYLTAKIMLFLSQIIVQRCDITVMVKFYGHYIFSLFFLLFFTHLYTLMLVFRLSHFLVQQ